MQSLKDQFRDILRFFRERKGLSYTELGEKLGVSGSYISAIEKGKKGVSLQRIEEFAETLNFHISFDLNFKTVTGLYRVNQYQVDIKKEGERYFEQFQIRDYKNIIEAYKEAEKNIYDFTENSFMLKGVGILRIKNGLRAIYQGRYKQQAKYFSIAKYGKNKALDKAIAFRVEGLIKNCAISQSKSDFFKSHIKEEFLKHNSDFK